MEYIGYLMMTMPFIGLFILKVKRERMKAGDVLIVIVFMLIAVLYGTLASYFISPEGFNFVVFGGE